MHFENKPLTLIKFHSQKFPAPLLKPSASGTCSILLACSWQHRKKESRIISLPYTHLEVNREIKINFNHEGNLALPGWSVGQADQCRLQVITDEPGIDPTGVCL